MRITLMINNERQVQLLKEHLENYSIVYEVLNTNCIRFNIESFIFRPTNTLGIHTTIELFMYNNALEIELQYVGAISIDKE